MRVTAALPMARLDRPEEFLTGQAVAEIARAAESAGFDAVSVSEHPFPDDDWLRRGAGHQTLDPFVALAFAAAATTRIKLRTSLLILPYRNPFLTARAVASLDVLSGGRVILGVGTGYLEPEFRALGVAFEERNALTDEAIVAMRRAWTETGVRMTGRHFEAAGHTMAPPPTQPGGPPIWVGGNSRRAIRRAVELGDGWAPMPYAGAATVSRRTAPLRSLDELRGLIAYASDHAAETGRSRPLGLSLGLEALPIEGVAGAGDDRLLAAAETLAGLGVTDTSLGLGPPAYGAALTREAYVGELERLGRTLLPRLRALPANGVEPSAKPTVR